MSALPACIIQLKVKESLKGVEKNHKDSKKQ
jgi:hypothetical protein